MNARPKKQPVYQDLLEISERFSLQDTVVLLIPSSGDEGHTCKAELSSRKAVLSEEDQKEIHSVIGQFYFRFKAWIETQASEIFRQNICTLRSIEMHITSLATSSNFNQTERTNCWHYDDDGDLFLHVSFGEAECYTEVIEDDSAVKRKPNDFETSVDFHNYIEGLIAKGLLERRVFSHGEVSLLNSFGRMYLHRRGDLRKAGSRISVVVLFSKAE